MNLHLNNIFRAFSGIPLQGDYLLLIWVSIVLVFAYTTGGLSRLSSLTNLGLGLALIANVDFVLVRVLSSGAMRVLCMYVLFPGAGDVGDEEETG